MEIDNETNDPVDYEQTGGDDERREGGTDGPPCPVTGTVPGSGGKRTFVPCGRPPFTVTVSGNGNTCTTTGIMRPNATLTVKSLDPCDVEVDE